MQEVVEGFIIKERDYLESSKILDVFTKKYGIISVISKGCKKPKSSLCSLSSKMTYGNLNIYYKEGKLSTLTNIDLINSLSTIKKDILKISYTTYIMELVFQVVKQIDIYEEIYDLFIDTVLKINDNLDPLVLTNILELKLLDYLGVSPMLDNCSICGSKDNIVTLSLEKHGLLCKNCRTNEYLYSLDAIKHIRMYSYLDISKISKIEVNEKVKEEINKYLDRYYEKYTGLYLNSKEFIKRIKEISED